MEDTIKRGIREFVDLFKNDESINKDELSDEDRKFFEDTDDNSGLNYLIKQVESLDGDKQKSLERYINDLYNVDQNIIQFFKNNEKPTKLNTSKIDKFKLTIFKLQKNVILLYIKPNVSSECSEIINKFLNLTNNKIELVNTILAKRLEQESTGLRGSESKSPESRGPESRDQGLRDSESGDQKSRDQKINFSDFKSKSIDKLDLLNKSPQNINKLAEEIIGNPIRGEKKYLKVYNNDKILIGGSVQPKEILIIIFKLKEMYNKIFNNDTILSIISLILYKEDFTSVIESNFEGITSMDFINLFFIETSQYLSITDQLKPILSYKYNKKNYIFGYIILNKIYKILFKSGNIETNLAKFINSNQITLLTLLIELYQRIKLITEMSEKLSSKSIYFKNKSKELLDKNKRVHTFAQIKPQLDKSQFKLNEISNNNVSILYYQKKFKFGSYDDVFKTVNKDIAQKESMNQMIEKIIEGKNTVIITQDQPNINKKDTFIYSSDGLYSLLCSNNFKTKITSIKLSANEIYVKHDFTKDMSVKKMYELIPKLYQKEFNFTDQWRGKDSKNTSLYQSIIDTVVEERIIEPTSYNKYSTRSHVIIELKLTHTDNKVSNLIICDVPAIENNDYNNLSTILKLYEQYKTSDKYNDSQLIKYQAEKCRQQKNSKDPKCNNALINGCKYDITYLETYLKDTKNIKKEVTDYINYLDAEIKKSISTEKQKLECEKDIINRIVANSIERTNENEMIRFSLIGMKTDVYSLLKKSLMSKSKQSEQYKGNQSIIIPIIYTQLSPECIKLSNDYINTFSDINENIQKDNYGLLFKVISELGVDMSSLNFYIFTSVDLNLNQYADNPPYIDLNSFIDYENQLDKAVSNAYIESSKSNEFIELEEIEKLKIGTLKTIINKLIDILKSIEYYKTSKNFISLKNINYEQSMIRSQLDNMINEIMYNNSFTPIGCLETLQQYLNIAAINYSCST